MPRFSRISWKRRDDAEPPRIESRIDARSGFLQSALDALKLPVDSQLLVFSRGSLQGKRIGEQNPRAIFFNDAVTVGYIHGAPLLELAVFRLTLGQSQPPTVIVDHNADMIRIVKGSGAAIERGVIEVPLG